MNWRRKVGSTTCSGSWTQSGRKQHAVDARAPEAMPPLELDIRAQFARTLRSAADLRGQGNVPRLIELNGWQYWCYDQTVPDTPDHAHRRRVFQEIGDALHERGE